MLLMDMRHRIDHHGQDAGKNDDEKRDIEIATRRGISSENHDFQLSSEAAGGMACF